MTDAHSTVAEATSTSEGENGGRNQHQGSFGTLGASNTYTGDSKQCPEEILTQGPCSGQYVTAWLPYGLATLMPGRDVSFTLLNHLLLSILQRAKALLVDTCYKPCTRSTLSPRDQRHGSQKKAAQHRTARPAAGDLLETTHLLQPQLPNFVSYMCRKGILPAEMHGHIKWPTVYFLKEKKSSFQFTGRKKCS